MSSPRPGDSTNQTGELKTIDGLINDEVCIGVVGGGVGTVEVRVLRGVVTGVILENLVTRTALNEFFRVSRGAADSTL